MRARAWYAHLIAPLALGLFLAACSPGKQPAAANSARSGTSPAVSPRSGTSASQSGSPGIVPGGNVYAAVAVGNFAQAVAGITQRVYVPDSSGKTLWVIDPKTNKVVSYRIPGTELQHVTPAWDLTKLYVDDAGSDALTVIDPKTGAPGRTIRGVTDPYNLYFTPDGSKAIVVAEDKRRLDFRDPTNWKLIKSVGVPWAGVDHMDFTADGHFALASTEYSGIVVKIDVVKMQIAGTIKVGGLPIDVRLAPDGRVFYVANQGRNGVSLIDPVTMKEVKFIKLGKGAHGIAVSRDAKRFYVSNRRAGTVAVIDVSTRRRVATWRVGGTPDMLQVSPDGHRLWMSNRYNGSITVLDTRTGRVVKRIHLGGSPHGLCYFPQPGRISLGHNGVYR